jgi:hypothetical protein
MAREQVSSAVDTPSHSSKGPRRPAVPNSPGPGNRIGLPDSQAVGTPALVSRLAGAAGNRAVAGVVQRLVDPTERNWLRMLLTTGDEGVVTAAVRSGAANRILTMAPGDRTDTVGDVSDLVPRFVYRLGTSPGYDDEQTCFLISALEGAQSNAALGRRLLALFESANPLAALAAISTIPDERVRAVLQGQPTPDAALSTVLGRFTTMAVPVHLVSIQQSLQELHDDIVDPDAFLSVADATRETAVENLLTPPAIASARASAIASGAAPPTFIKASYYEDLISALHIAVTRDYGWASVADARASMDTSTGGQVEGIAAEAKARVDAIFGRYGSAAAPALTFAGTNLVDQTLEVGNGYDMARWHVFDSGGPEISAVNTAHNAFDSTDAVKLQVHVVAHYSDTDDGTSPPAPPGLDASLGMAAAERRRRLDLIDRMWPGQALPGGGQVKINTRLGANRKDTRSKYWGLFKTLIHEYLHTTAHPTYTAWYNTLADPHHTIAYQEGFTDLFTRKTWTSIYPDEIASNGAFRRRIQGDDTPDMEAVGGYPPHYPEMEEAIQMEPLIGQHNMMAAYFRGATDVLGGDTLPR